ncbi:MAG: adenylate/guanylate cyclase domain-containing protein [Hyphomicrobiaceae bacterium]
MTGDEGHHAKEPSRARRSRRALRAVFAADVAGFSGHVSVDETAAFQSFGALREIALEQLKAHDGWLFGMPGDGIFALFESAIDAVKCGLAMQAEISQCSETSGMKLRVGVHLGEVRFDNDLPFGETLAIAARLESLAEPGSMLVSASVVDAVAARVSAIFEPRGTPRLKNIPRQIATFAVVSRDAAAARKRPADGEVDLDRTTHLNRDVLRQVRDSEFGHAPAPRPAGRDGPSGDDDELTETPSAVPDDDAHPTSSLPVGDADHRELPQQSLIDRLTANSPMSEIESSPDQMPSADEALPDPANSGQPTPLENISVGIGEEAATDRSISPELRELLIETLAHHVGPLASVLVERFAEHVASPDELVNLLEKHVPSGDERTSFRLRATRACLRCK